jgi:hypothetical protein
MRRPLLVTGLLATLGAAIGAVTAPILSYLATTVATASLPAGRVAYFFSPAAFAVAGAIGIPVLAWLLMRRVPLWRAVSEPMIGAALGLLLGLGSIPLLNLPIVAQPVFVLTGAVGAALRLRVRHRQLGESSAGVSPDRRLNAS